MRYWISVLVLLVSVGTAHAEIYVAGQAGVAFPHDLSKVQWSVGGNTVPGNNLSQDTSALYGGKVGYYFDQLRWLGVETEVYRATPNLPMQSLSIGGVPLGTMTPIDHSVITWSPVMVLVRLPSGSLPLPVEPYAGVGLGVFFSSLSGQTFTSSTTEVGFTSQVGLRYRVTPNWAVFGEWKYNRATLAHENLLGTSLNVDATYSAHLLSFGVGYHF